MKTFHTKYFSMYFLKRKTYPYINNYLITPNQNTTNSLNIIKKLIYIQNFPIVPKMSLTAILFKTGFISEPCIAFGCQVS